MLSRKRKPRDGVAGLLLFLQTRRLRRESQFHEVGPHDAGPDERRVAGAEIAHLRELFQCRRLRWSILPEDGPVAEWEITYPDALFDAVGIEPPDFARQQGATDTAKTS